MFKPYVKHSALKLSSRDQSTTMFFPKEIASLYNFPNSDGIGQKVGIIELGGGFRDTDILIYFKNLGIKADPNIMAISIDGATNNTDDQTGANFEVALDLEIIATLVPKAQIFVYFAPNTISGFYNAINTAIDQGCKVISISWGAQESALTEKEMNSFNILFKRAVENKCTIIAAAEAHDFPASSPFVLACGGTTLKAANGSIVSELVWTKSDVSSIFNKPDYQMHLDLSKRSIPDVYANADPDTGYRIFMAGVNYIVGGTGAAAPLWAALITRLNQLLGFCLGAIHRHLYQTDTNVWRFSPNGVALMNYLQKPVSTISAGFTIQIVKNIPFTVRFIDASKGNPVVWSWNFGDGTILLGSQNPTHVFSRLGKASINLTVTDKFGKSSTFTKNITVTS